MASDDRDVVIRSARMEDAEHIYRLEAEAFAPKLRRFCLKTPEIGAAFLSASMQPEAVKAHFIGHTIVAEHVETGEVWGAVELSWGDDKPPDGSPPFGPLREAAGGCCRACWAACMLSCMSSDKPAGNVAYIDFICVSPDARGRGLGHRLLAAAQAAAERRRSSAMVLHVARSNRARRLYEREGYVATGEVGCCEAACFSLCCGRTGDGFVEMKKPLHYAGPPSSGEAKQADLLPAARSAASKQEAAALL